MSAKRISVRQTGPNRFAVAGADGRIVRDNFPTLQVAWMWAAKRGLHQGRNKRKRETREIPNALVDDQIFGLPLLAKMSNLSYGEFLSRAHSGEFGPLIQVNDRAYGLRFGSWKAAVTARQVQIK